MGFGEVFGTTRVRNPYTKCVRIPYTFFFAFGFRGLDREAFGDTGAASAGRARGLGRTGSGRVLMGGSGGIDRDALGCPKIDYSSSQEGKLWRV